MCLGLISLNLLKEAIPIILAKVICDAESGMAKILKLKKEFIKSIMWLEEKLNKIIIWVKRIDKAGTGFIFDICEPIVFTIFCENSKAPIPINNEPKK